MTSFTFLASLPEAHPAAKMRSVIARETSALWHWLEQYFLQLLWALENSVPQLKQQVIWRGLNALIATLIVTLIRLV
jgi:dolichyl-phosphate-mannose--protein O-mannosyl transferase